jgi:hypothetical protein
MPNTFYVPEPRSPATELADDIDHLETTIPVLNVDVFPDAPNLATIGQGSADTVADEGTASTDSYSELELVDTTKAWDIDEWVGYYIRIVAGEGAGQRRTVDSNTATVITVTSEWGVPPDATSVYQILSRLAAPASETILYAGKVTGALTGCTRGYEPEFSNRAWPGGTHIARVFTAQDLRALQNRVVVAEGDIVTNQGNIDTLIENQTLLLLFSRWGAI